MRIEVERPDARALSAHGERETRAVGRQRDVRLLADVGGKPFGRGPPGERGRDRERHPDGAAAAMPALGFEVIDKPGVTMVTSPPSVEPVWPAMGARTSIMMPFS